MTVSKQMTIRSWRIFLWAAALMIAFVVTLIFALTAWDAFKDQDYSVAIEASVVTGAGLVFLGWGFAAIEDALVHA